MREMTYRVLPEDDGRKIKNILRQKLNVSASVLTQLKKSPQGILVNGESVYATKEVKSGDIIKINIEDKMSQNIVPSDIELNIIYEDEDILCINKPRNMPTHPSQNHHADTLANGVMNYFKGTDFTFRVITRLDKDTSGVVLIAKNKISASVLSGQMQNGEIAKEYLALCHNEPPKLKGETDAPIARKEGSSIEREVSANGKRAVTKYEVLKTMDSCSLIKLNPITGRTHQLRVHMSHIGCPIYGDDMYGSDAKGERCRLHCAKIEFVHPITQKALKICADMPDDMFVNMP